MQVYIAPHRRTSIGRERHPMSGSQLHSINESRRRLGNIGRDAVYDLLNTGQLEAKKIGRRTFVTDQSIENYIQNLPPFRRPSRELRATSSTISSFGHRRGNERRPDRVSRGGRTASKQRFNLVLGASKRTRRPKRKRRSQVLNVRKEPAETKT
jgi:hypothetical protein